MADQKLRVILEAKADKLIKALDKSSNKLKQFGADASRIGKKLSVGLTLPIAAAGGAAIKLASDFEESLNKVDVSFKKSSASVKEFSKTTLTQFGIAQGTALDMAAMFGDMGTSMGLTTGQAAKMSTSMVGLAGDLASFKNIQIEEATTALAAVFTGETESLKRLGIVMTEANLKNFALTQGITKNIKEMTQAEKTTLRYMFVMANTANAQGDFARTQDGAANQMRIFTESLKQIGAEIGSFLLPAFTEIVTKVNKALASFMAFDDRTKKIIITVAGLLAAVGPLLVALGFLPKILGALSAGITVVKGALMALTSPVGLVVAALAAVAYVVYKNWNAILPIITMFYNNFVDLYNQSAILRGAIGALGGVFKAVFTYAKGYISAVVNVFSSFGKVVSAIISGDFKSIGGVIKEAISSTKDIVVETGTEMANNVVDGFNNGVKNKLEHKTPGQIQAGLTNVADNIKSFASGLFGGIDLFPNGIVDNEQIATDLDTTNELLEIKGAETKTKLNDLTQEINGILQGGLQNMAIGIGEALGNAIVNGGNLAGALASVVLGTIGDMAISLGTLAIKMGITLEGIVKSLQSLNPVVAVLAGIALIALGTAVKAGAANISKGGKGGGGGGQSGPRSGAVAAFANGGIVSGPTLGLMGEYAGAKSNPEVIAPLDKLKNMIGSRQAQQVNVGGEFRLNGQDLVVALQRAEKQRGRIK